MMMNYWKMVYSSYINYWVYWDTTVGWVISVSQSKTDWHYQSIAGSSSDKEPWEVSWETKSERYIIITVTACGAAPTTSTAAPTSTTVAPTTSTTASPTTTTTAGPTPYICVSGASVTNFNSTYQYSGSSNGKPYWTSINGMNKVHFKTRADIGTQRWEIVRTYDEDSGMAATSNGGDNPWDRSYSNGASVSEGTCS